MKEQFLQEGQNLDVFISSSLSKCTVEKIRDELKDVVARKGTAEAKKKMRKLLANMCAQDVHESGGLSHGAFNSCTIER